MKTKEYVEVQFTMKFRSATVIDWCEKNIGRRGTHWEVRFRGFDNVGMFEFARYEDAAYFILKWK